MSPFTPFSKGRITRVYYVSTAVARRSARENGPVVRNARGPCADSCRCQRFVCTRIGDQYLASSVSSLGVAPLRAPSAKRRTAFVLETAERVYLPNAVEPLAHFLDAPSELSLVKVGPTPVMDVLPNLPPRPAGPLGRRPARTEPHAAGKYVSHRAHISASPAHAFQSSEHPSARLSLRPLMDAVHFGKVVIPVIIEG
jgi:hypothetical protein